MATTRCDLRSLSLEALGVPPWSPPPRAVASTLPASAEIAIVGAGVTGLSASLALAARKVDVVMLDRSVGSGATTRSGGIVLGDTLAGPAPGFDGCEQALADWIKRRNIDCDFEWTGCLELARDSRLPDRPIDWNDSGPVQVVAEVPGGVLNPAKLLHGLYVSAMHAGVRIVDGATVRRIESGAGGPILSTSRGQLGARHVVMAVDALSWRQIADPWAERHVTVVLQTEALDDERLAAIGLGARKPFYTRTLPLLWGRPMPDRSFLFGRELLPFPWSPSARELGELVALAGDRLIGRVRQLHPRLREVTVRRVWAGPIARTDPGVPTLIRDAEIPGVWWAGGFGGHGLAQAFRLGVMAADCVQPRIRKHVRAR